MLDGGPVEGWTGFVARRILGRNADPANINDYDVLFLARQSPGDYTLGIAMADRRGGFTWGMGFGPSPVKSVYVLKLQPGDDYQSIGCVQPGGDVIFYWGEGGYSTPS